jgi:hypothetical protein
LNRWKNNFSQLLHAHKVSDVSKREIHTAEPLVPDPSPFEVETVTTKLKKHKSTGSDQILAELIQAGGEILHSKIHKLINYIWNKEKLQINERSLLFYQFTGRVIKLTVVIIGGISLL